VAAPKSHTAAPPALPLPAPTPHPPALSPDSLPDDSGVVGAVPPWPLAVPWPEPGAPALVEDPWDPDCEPP